MFKTGRYEIVGELGRGSMGIVYEGYDPLIHRRVAIKTMRIEGLTTREYEQYKARFQAEAQAAGVLEHPNIVTIHDFGEDNGVLYLAMEFLKGKSLRQIVDEKGILPVETVIPIFQQVASALDHAHEHHIIHRDIKPANIMVLDSGLVKVTDFGIAKVLSTETGMTYSGQILGTPNYMSPEQVKGERVDGRSDIFALGVILYELVTGQKPFGGQNVTTVMYKIINEAPTSPLEVDPAIHAGLAYITNRALAKRPEDRYQTCRELADDLANYRNLVKSVAANETVMAQRPPIGAVAPAGSQAAPAVKLRRFPMVGAVAAVLIVAAGLAAGYYFRSRQRALTATPTSPPANVEAATKTLSSAANPVSNAPSGLNSNPAGANPAGPGSGASGVPAESVADAGHALGSTGSAAGETASPPLKVDASRAKESKQPKELSSAGQEKKARPATRNASSAASQGNSPSRVNERQTAGSSAPPRTTEVAKVEPAPTPPAPTGQTVAQPSSGSPNGGGATSTSVAADAAAPGTEYVLETDPIGIDVFIDGKLWGRTENDKPVVASLAAGDHTLILKYHGVEVLKRQIKKTNDAQWQRWKLPITEPVP